MSDKLTPTGREYQGEKYALKESLNGLKERLRGLDKTAIVQGLEKYKNVTPGKGGASDNSFELVGLYQAAMKQIDAQNTPAIDCRFGPKTYDALFRIQSKFLGLDPKKCDGLPGPETTEVLIRALTPIPKPEPVEMPKEKPSLVANYLLLEGYRLNDDGNYVSKDKDFFISIDSGRVRGIPAIGRATPMNEREKLIVARVQKCISGSR